jgi:hypothetical protein
MVQAVLAHITSYHNVAILYRRKYALRDIGSELSLDSSNGAKNLPEERTRCARGAGILGGEKFRYRASQRLRTSRTALGMLSPRACTTFRMRVKLALHTPSPHSAAPAAA